MHLRKCLHRLQGVSKIFQTDLNQMYAPICYSYRKSFTSPFLWSYLAQNRIVKYACVFGITSMMCYEHILVLWFEFVGHHNNDNDMRLCLMLLDFYLLTNKSKNILSACTLGRRKSVAPQELNKTNKRMSCVGKPPDMQTKRGKVRFCSFCHF